MRLKYFLRGLGVGIVFTTIILTIVNPKSKKETLTDTEIIEKARMLGMIKRDEWNILNSSQQTKSPSDSIPNISPSPSELSKTSEPIKSELPKTSEPIKSEVPKTSEPVKSELPKTSEPAKNVSPKPSEQGKSTLPSSEKQVKTSDTKKEGDYFTLQVQPNMGSEQVAKILQEKGIIEDAQDFNQFLGKNGYQTRIQDGEHKILKNADYTEIAEALTR